MVCLVAPACSEMPRNIQSPALRRSSPTSPFPPPLIIVSRYAYSFKASNSRRSPTPFSLPPSSRLPVVFQPPWLLRQVLYLVGMTLPPCFVFVANPLCSSRIRSGALTVCAILATTLYCLSLVLGCCLQLWYLGLSFGLGFLDAGLVFERCG